MEFTEVFLRTFATFVTVYILARILGKKLISQMTFFDFVAGVSMGSITGSIIFAKDIDLTVALLGLVIFVALVLVIDILTIKSYVGRKIFNGSPAVVIRNGSLLEKEMLKARLNVDELLLLLRKKNIFYLNDVEIGILETDGTLSVLKMSEKMPANKNDLNISTPSRGYPQTFIIDGKIIEKSLISLGRDQQWVDSVLASQSIATIRDVVVAQVDEQGQLYIDIRKK